MKIKIVSLNTWNFRFKDEVLEFLEQENPDVILMQELTRNGEGKTEGVCPNGYEVMQNKFSMESVYAPMWRLTKNEAEYDVGLAIFSKFRIRRSSSEFYQLGKLDCNYEEIFHNPENFPGLLLEAELEFAETNLSMLTTHFVWSLYPDENEYQIKAGQALMELLSEKRSFILAGDFNLTAKSKTVGMMIKEFENDTPQVESTLHPQIHPAGKKGIAVDHVFHRGNKINKVSAEIPIVPVSDHLPIVVEYEID